MDAAPDPQDFMAACAAYEAEVSRLQADAKRAAIRFAAVTCSCVPHWSWADRLPPQAGCAVHGNIMVTPDGSVL